MLNWYKWRYHGFSTYFNAGAEAIANDNFEDLSKREILDTYTFTNSNQTRELTKKTTVYTGLYRDPHLVLSSFINFYAFLFGNKAAIHLQGDVNFISKNNTDLRFERPIYNSTIGLLLSPIESKNKDNKSVQNVELFIKIKDLFNGLKYENKVEDKTTIGLRFTTPIKFN